VLGGVTRLTGSGLSITDWRPVTGVLPPFSEQAWQEEFDSYRASPEYQQVNRGMSMSEFKVIYGYEYAHRLLARMLGLVFVIPLVWFWLRGRIPPRLRWPLVGLLGLGMLQGYMGWFMVASGLVDIPRVSPYRLAAHLSLALIIYAVMFWLALGPVAAAQRPASGGSASGMRPCWWCRGHHLLRRVRRRAEGGPRLQHLPADGGAVGARRPVAPRAGVAQLLREPATVQFTHRVLGHGHAGCWCCCCGRARWRLPLSRTQRWAFHMPGCGGRSCRPRSASRPCCCTCRSASARPTRAVPWCCCQHGAVRAARGSGERTSGWGRAAGGVAGRRLGVPPD
jgi:heme a synthase